VSTEQPDQGSTIIHQKLYSRLIDAEEGKQMGLLNAIANDAFEDSLQLAKTICQHPQDCMRGDRLSSLSLPVDHGQRTGVGRWNVQGEERAAMLLEFEHGLKSLSFLGQAVDDFLEKKKSKL
jgi:enoyl-CoA hydratase